ncbi:MAG: tetratricopeptide repeat protein [Candidatus Omnitrophica bacterium]|nr:tetratricopeptide repeat protein [Candidatus Omnitrophota bacterium]
MLIKMTFLSRAIVFYFIMAALVYCVIDKDKLEKGRKIRSHYFFQARAYTDLVSFLEEEGDLEPGQWRKYAQYADQLRVYIPQSVEAYHLRGVIDYHLDRKDNAVRSFQMAIRVNPDFFLSYYNLGLVLFEKKEYQEAARVFKAAFQLNPQKTVRVLRASKVLYQPLLKSVEREKKINLMDRVKEAYQEAYLMNILCYLNQQDYQGLLFAARAALRSRVGRDEVYVYYQAFALEQLGLDQSPPATGREGAWRPPMDSASRFIIRLY